jgi:hypothetical protein
LDSRDSEAQIKILLSLDKKPARPTQIVDELGLHHSTVMHALRKSLLAKNGIIIQLEDGRYALKWYDSDEDAVIRKYEQIREKLLRNPLPEEFAGLMRKTPSEAGDMLYKHVAGYREPTSEDIGSSENRLFKNIVLGSWSKKDGPTNKKSLYEKGIKLITVEGINKEILEEILAGIGPDSYSDAQSYLKKYPLMQSKLSVITHDTELHLMLDWSADARQALRTIAPWNQIAEARIPEKFDESYHFLLGSSQETDVFLGELSENYVPSSKILDYLLRMLSSSQRGELTLASLKKFCQNALDVGQLKDEMMQRMVIELTKFAFDQGFIRRYDDEKASVENAERNTAFEIIELFNIRTEGLIGPAKNYVFRILSNPEGFDFDGYINGPQFNKVVAWLAKDPNLKKELIDRTEKLWENETESDRITSYIYFLSSLRR